MGQFQAFPAVLDRGQLRIDERPSLRAKLRRTPRRRALQLVGLAKNLPGLMRLVARIHRAGFGHAARSEPVLVFKYLGHYLANSFGTARRLRIISHHYQTLATCLPELDKFGFPRHDIVLWSHPVEHDTFSITLCMPGLQYLEGDLSVVFSINGLPLHQLSFTCIPGKEVGLEAETALFVGGSQGFPGTARLIRHSSRAIGEISPPAMLVLAPQALAKRLGADAILGVSAQEQTSLRAHPAEAKSRYDAFWEVIGGECEGRFYRLPRGIVSRDAWHLSSPHRARARRKRELKGRILSQIRESVERLLLATFSVSAELLGLIGS